MQLTHDKLIDDLGPLRRSGVHWTQHYAGEGREILATLHESAPDLDDVDAAAAVARDAAEVRTRLQDPNSMLTVAWVIATLPEGVYFDGDGIKS